ncbi:hypothetical protein HXX76_005944 [Chlamydomonas incerta]|uniref:Glycosyltransferase 61 catalytic domain-containing protein n=1 Tax=Chlamydomonas incerta TaxID=51695 RepID=A0A835TGD9_CHLIN|nr:hypothetical protein HXX76_005944 [Chlamydomonas incerta]|eukprot:KAG2437285.1 hypothetical protein HXX76_005944 [Chlamydomonas incerta]
MGRQRTCGAALLGVGLLLASLHGVALAQNLPQGQDVEVHTGKAAAADATAAAAVNETAAAAEKPLPLPQAQAAGGSAEGGGQGTAAAAAGGTDSTAADSATAISATKPADVTGDAAQAQRAQQQEQQQQDTPEIVVPDPASDEPNFKYRGPEWHPRSYGTTNCSAPTPALDEAGNIFGCPVLRDVCVDQGVIIYQDARYHPWTSEIRFPGLNITDILWNTPSVLGIGDKWKIGKNRYQPIVVRPWHHMEESPDVARPVFSACTTPLLFYHHFPFNVAEVYRFAVNNIYFMQQKLKFFDQHITLVPGNPPMSRVPSYTSFWLQPFSTHAVTSLGHLSQRREPDQASAPSAATGEGTAVRCFKRFIMCKITLKKPTGAYFEAGQFVAEHYMRRVEEERRTANYSARLAAALPGGAKQLADPTVLKVVFAVRSKSHKDVGRVLLNEDELIDRCNAQEVALPQPPGAAAANSSSSSAAGGGATVFSIFGSMACIRHIFGVDNLYDMWLVRQMDVLVGVHGSALTNAMFMRPGSSLIELRPFGFSGRESWPNIYMKSQTRRMDVFWFGIDVMSANLSSPGEFEKDMQDIYTRAKGCIGRDRNVAVPWEAMGHQLLNIAVTSRSVWRYKVLRYSHAYYVTHDLQAVELPGKEKWVPKELLTWFTDLDQERARAAAVPLTPEGEAAARAEEEALLAEITKKREAEAAAAADAEAVEAVGQGRGGGAGGGAGGGGAGAGEDAGGGGGAAVGAGGEAEPGDGAGGNAGGAGGAFADPDVGAVGEGQGAGGKGGVAAMQRARQAFARQRLQQQQHHHAAVHKRAQQQGAAAAAAATA